MYKEIINKNNLLYKKKLIIIIMFYSQFGEDKLLSNYFNDDYIGVCVEVGAYDGITGSNTYHFENRGWETLCIEPIPEAFNKCASIRKKCINCCVSNYESENIDYFVVRVNGNNTSAISSLNIDERLIESHKHFINNIEKINVNVKTLNNIFAEINYPKIIDFISIDTENTELDVLKGLNFDEYYIKFLVIENNFDEPQVEEYLKTKNFKKLFRNSVNDFYVNNDYINTKIVEGFVIKKANYYIEDSDNNGIVTDTVKILLQKYKLSDPTKTTDIIVSNHIFTDTYQLHPKKLYITIENIYDNKQYKFEFDESKQLDFGKIYNSLLKNIIGYTIEVSIGEIVDKYSILELKTKYITDNNKIKEIQKEMDILEKIVCNIKKTFFYKLLLIINEQIWLDTDTIKELTNYKKDTDTICKFAEISNNIFENNQRRFRLKNYFNIIDNSNIKEQKSYNETKCFIEISTDEDIYDKISEINYLCISYDIIYISCNFKDIFNKLFKNPNIVFIDSVLELTNYHKESLNTFSIEINNRHKFEFEPIKYLSGGKLGDFLNQLSVICEKYYETGRKGILYIYDLPQIDDKFIFGLKKTYEDTYNVIKNLVFIKDYTIYNNEDCDVKLSEWRSNLVSDNWHNIYKKKYKVSWGKHKWLTSLTDTKWSDKIIINITPYRFMSSNAFTNLLEKVNNQLDKCVFVSNEKEHYNFFLNKTNLKIDFYQPNNFDEVVTIVNSCKMAYLGFSSMAVIANALHKNHIIIGTKGFDAQLNNLKEYMPHVLDILI